MAEPQLGGRTVSQALIALVSVVGLVRFVIGLLGRLLRSRVRVDAAWAQIVDEHPDQAGADASDEDRHDDPRPNERDRLIV